MLRSLPVPTEVKLVFALPWTVEKLPPTPLRVEATAISLCVVRKDGGLGTSRGGSERTSERLFPEVKDRGLRWEGLSPR